jgi:hypothetical protein
MKAGSSEAKEAVGGDDAHGIHGRVQNAGTQEPRKGDPETLFFLVSWVPASIDLR